MKESKVIGIMSGTSLDGIDIVYVNFRQDKNWRYDLINSKKISSGKMNKFKEDNSLMTQQWVMEPKKKVKNIIEELGFKDLKIVDFYRIKIGVLQYTQIIPTKRYRQF